MNLCPRVLLVVAALLLGSVAEAKEKKEKVKIPGDGKIRAGFITAGVSAAVGSTLFLLGSVFLPECHDSSEECGEQDRGRREAGLAITGIGAAVGIPLIVWGVRQRDEYYETQVQLGFKKVEHGGAAVLTWKLP